MTRNLQEEYSKFYYSKWVFVRFQVLTAASMKMAVFEVVVPCSLVEVYRRFRGTCCLHRVALITDAVSISKTSIKFYQIARRNNPEDSHLQMGFYLGLFFNVVKISNEIRRKLSSEFNAISFAAKNCSCYELIPVPERRPQETHL
jgi:hypothetical protein